MILCQFSDISCIYFYKFNAIWTTISHLSRRALQLVTLTETMILLIIDSVSFCFIWLLFYSECIRCSFGYWIVWTAVGCVSYWNGIRTTVRHVISRYRTFLRFQTNKWNIWPGFTLISNSRWAINSLSLFCYCRNPSMWMDCLLIFNLGM